MSQHRGAASVRTTEHIVRTDDGAQLAVTLLGPPTGSAAATVVLAHGWGASREAWAEVTGPLVAAGHPVVLYDQRGHGVSTAGTAPVTLNRLRDDLAGVLEHVDARDAILVGHSGGGYAALAYAVGVPSEAAVRLRGLVLVSTASHGQDTPAGELRMFGSRIFSRLLSHPPLGRRILAQMLGRRPDPAAAETTRRLFAAITPTTRADFFRTSCGMDLRPGLGAVHIPAVVLTGTADRIIAPSFGVELARALPDARLDQVPGAGHMLPLEAIARIVAAVTALNRG